MTARNQITARSLLGVVAGGSFAAGCPRRPARKFLIAGHSKGQYRTYIR